MNIELTPISLIDGKLLWTSPWGVDSFHGFIPVKIFESDFSSNSFYFSHNAHINRSHILFIGEKEYKNVKSKGNN